MRKAVLLTVLVGGLFATTAWPQQQTMLVVNVSDIGKNDAPIAGVSVRILRPDGRELSSGLTDGTGSYTAVLTAAAGQELVVQYRLGGYLKDPAQLRVHAAASPRPVKAWLISKADARPVYLKTVAANIDRLATEAASDTERQELYRQAWETILELSDEQQQLVAASLEGSRFLNDVATYRLAKVEGELSTLRAEEASRREAERAEVQRAEAERAAATLAADRAAAAAAAADRVASVDMASRRLVYSVTLSEDQGNFKFGKIDLPDSAKARLDELIGQLKANPQNVWIEIEGHTDNVGDKKTNERIGEERAEAVKRYLYEQHQVPLHKINVISYGEEKPVAPNNTRGGRAQNRRVVVKVLQ